MLVFCTYFTLGPNVPLRMVSISACSWLNHKGSFGLTAEKLSHGADYHFPQGHWVRSWKTQDNEYPAALSISYSHPDSEIQGRFWNTEIGARRFADGHPLEVSVRLRTDEQSLKVVQLPQLTIPFIVHDLIRDGSPVPPTPGLAIQYLHDYDDIEKLKTLLQAPPRRHPVILVSKEAQSEKPLIDVDKLRQKVEGLADIVVYPSSLSHLVSTVAGRRCTVWDGGVSFVWSIHDRDNPEHYHGHIFTPDSIRSMWGGEKLTIEHTLLLELTHTTNWLNERRHISPEHVRELARSSELRKARTIADLTGDYKMLAEQMADELSKTKSENQQQIKYYDDHIEEVNSDRDSLKREKQDLERLLASSQAALRAAEVKLGYDKSDQAIAVLRELVGPCLDPETALRAISQLFPTQVMVLEEAFQSASASSKFRDRPEFWRLLWLFSTDYWEALCQGHQGDAEARKMFGSHYAAHEAEGTSSSKRMKRERTFRYQGEDVVMESHLKVGTNSPSPVEAIRVHFIWDPQRSLLVIGYAGKHLPTLSGS
jgi:hypothetical protein